MTHAERRKRRQQIADALRNGGSFAEIADRFGVSVDTVKAVRRDNNLPTQPRRRHDDTVAREEAIAEALRNHMTAAEIAAEVGVTRQTVYNVADKCGLNPGRKFDRRDYTKRRRRVIALARKDKMPIKQIAAEAQVAYCTALQWINDAGIHVRRRINQAAAKRRPKAQWWSVLALIMRGKTNVQIAEELDICAPFVSNTRRRAREAGVKVPNADGRASRAKRR